MFIKHFREVQFRVPDPQRPGHTVFDRRMDTAGTHAISHGGKEYHADVDGWFDVPQDVAEHFLHYPGWCSPEMVDEEVVAGRIRVDDADRLPSTRELLESRQPEKAAKTPGRRKSKASPAS